MPHEATLIYSTTLLRQAVFAFWRRSVGVGFFVALLIAALGLVVLMALGQASWLIGGLAVVLVLGIAFATVVYACTTASRCASSARWTTLEPRPRRGVLVHHEFGHRHDHASVVRGQRVVAVPERVAVAVL